METIMLLMICLLIGFLAGFMSGMFGIGGGSVRTPLLYVAGLPLLGAFGINLLVIPFSSIIGAISHRRNINWKFAPYVVVGGTFGSVIGAFLAGLIPTLVLAIIFVIVSFMTVSGIHLDRIAPKLAQKINPNAKNMVSGTFFINLLTGMRGGSGGSLFPPFLRTMRFDMREAIATSLFATIFTAIPAVIIYWYRGDIIWLPALAVVIGSIAGARMGSLISLKTKHVWLEIGLSIFVVILALIVLFKALSL
jgi:uncharacterized membrane protein YfcA